MLYLGENHIRCVVMNLRHLVLFLSLLGSGLTHAQSAQYAPAKEATIGDSVTQTLGQIKNQATEAVLAALNFLDVNYTWGGKNHNNGFDCSGFTRYIFNLALGVKLPHSAREQAQYNELQVVERDNLQPGDLVFFNTMQRAFSHVGIYAGDNRFIHAPRRGFRVRLEDMSQAYWASRFNGARRVDPDTQL